jgi:hypothetical protein
MRYPVVASLFGLISIAALSFFFKQIAFSRVVVGIGAAVSALLMAAWRAVWKGDRETARRALVVGPAETARRLHRLLQDNPAPPIDVIGYVSVEPDEQNIADADAPRLVGRLQQLGDVARLEKAGCLVFVPGSLSNEEIFGWMQTLRDRPLQFKMLGSTESHIIGKSSIDQLSLPALVEADQALGLTRSNIRHRIFDVTLAILVLIFSPLLVVANLAGNERARLLVDRLGMLPSVVSGRRSIVGFDERTDYRPPERLGIKPGLFPVSDETVIPHELDRRYGFYAVRQSAGIDWAIVRKRLAPRAARNQD